MKTFSRIAMGAAVLMLLVATVQPAQAACGGARLMNNTGAFLVSNPNWGGAGADRSCQFLYGCYLAESGGGPISANVAGVFWGFDAATDTSHSDPQFDAGIDNGSWDVSNWTKSRVDAGYYYPGFLTLDGGSNGAAGLPANWSFPVDGCTDSIDPQSCTCIMVTDQWDGLGYFMVDSSITDAAGDYQYTFDTLDQGGTGAPTMMSLPTPRPEVVTSDRDPTSTDITLQIHVADIAGDPSGRGDYRDPGCDCNVGYLIYQQVVGQGGFAPTDRNIASGWELATLPAAPATQYEFGDPDPMIIIDCNPALSEQVYLATALVEQGGLVGANVSENSFTIECDSQLAEPNRPDRGRGRSSDAPRGRDNNRGQRDR